MNNKQTISVFKILNSPFAISTEEGESLFLEIDKYLVQNDYVILDFSNIDIIVSTFLNASVGQLYGKHNAEFVKDHLSVSNMTDDDLVVLKKVTDRAKEYFSDKNGLENLLKKHFPDA